MKWHWGTTMIVALAALATASAVSAAPRDIVRDYADNGRLDGNYTAAEIQAALQNPTVQGYISPTERVGVVAGAAHVQQAPAAAAPAAAEVARAQQLPFTGQDVTVLVIGGLLLLVAGGALRLIGRPKAAPPS